MRGVLHAAAVVEDAALANITDELIERDWAPKVYGGWNLHSATADQPLDWFCTFSSAAALVGSPGQGAYAAANSWLDAFTHWRRAQGLPATAIAWGAWAEIGRATAMAEGSGAAIAPDEGAYAFQALLQPRPCLQRIRTGDGNTVVDRLRAAQQVRRGVPDVRAKPQGRKRISRGAEDAAARRVAGRLRRMISDQISRILRRSVDPDRSLSEYGVDSLGNLELRTRIETETGIRITSTDITTVRGLAEVLREKLTPKEDAALPS